MVALVLRLRIDSLLGAARGDLRHRVRRGAAVALLVIAVVVVCGAVDSLQTTDAARAQVATVLGGSALVIGYLVVPLITGTQDVLDPRRFAVLAPRPRPLAGALAAASLLSAGALALLPVVVALVALWTAQGVPPTIAVVGAVLGAVTCLLMTRVAQALGTLALRHRRSREVTVALVVTAIVIVVPAVLYLWVQPWERGAPPSMEMLASVLSATPLGAAWSLPGAALAGTALWPAVVSVVSVAGLAVLWVRLVERLLSTTERPVERSLRGGLGWFGVTPPTPLGAIGARSLVYWLRDPRYLANLAIVPVAAVLTVLPLLPVGVAFPDAVLGAIAVAALLFGWLAHNDLAYDSSALWMHVSAGVSGVADRVGRLIPVTTIAIPVLAVAIPAAVSLRGSWDALPAALGACASLFLCGLGLSCVTSALLPYIVSAPGDGPFEQPQRSTGGTGPAVVMFGALLLSAPTLWLAWRALTEPATALPALGVGLATGLLVLAGGIALGASIYTRRQGALMEFAESM